MTIGDGLKFGIGFYIGYWTLGAIDKAIEKAAKHVHASKTEDKTETEKPAYEYGNSDNKVKMKIGF